MNADIVVIGAGTVGAAIAYGLAGRGARVLLVDGVDRDFRAATANFGLVWLHGKGLGMPAYQHLTRRAVQVWPDFAAELTELTGIDLHYERNGGLAFCEGEAGVSKRTAELTRLDEQSGLPAPDWEMIDRSGLEKLLPKVRLGPAISGASLGRLDGHANPLRLLTALHKAFLRRGGEILSGQPVHGVEAKASGGFALKTSSGSISTPRLVIAAGLGSASLADQLGLTIPIRPQRGQILVTERFEPFLPLPTLNVRQTREGTVMIGVTNEDVGLNAATTLEAAASIAAGATREFPGLSEARLVRQWAGLRILTPDGFPVYAQSQSRPGAFVALCHSGVTLAAEHATTLANAIEAGRLPPSLEHFHPRRFDVPKAA